MTLIYFQLEIFNFFFLFCGRLSRFWRQVFQGDYDIQNDFLKKTDATKRPALIGVKMSSNTLIFGHEFRIDLKRHCDLKNDFSKNKKKSR